MKSILKVIWFKGRINRQEYWISMILIWSPIFWIDDGLVPFDMIFPLFYLHLAQSVKRLQDRGKHGIFALEPVSTLFNISDEGDEGPNKYGLPPKGTFVEWDKETSDE